MVETARERFIAAGEKLYPILGYNKLSVRVLAAEARASAGMFHHLFDSKDAFIAEMLDHYGKIALGVRQNENLSSNPFEELREIAWQMLKAVRDNLAFVNRIFTDSADGVQPINEFVRRLMEVRTAAVNRLLDECAKIDGGEPANSIQRLGYFSSSISVPIVLGSRLDNMNLLPQQLSSNVAFILTDEAILQRIDWTMSAMFPNYRIKTQSKEKIGKSR